MVFKFSDRGFSYQDAVRLLGQDEPKIIKLIDRLGGVAVGSASVGTLGALAFFDVRDELVKWGNDVVRTIRDRVSGLSRFDRTRRLLAAHTVMVITSFYEALAEVTNGSGGLSDLRLTRAERMAIVAGGGHAASRASLRGYGQLVESLLHLSVAAPEPQAPYERARKEVAGLYAESSGRLRNFLSGLACWEALSETDRDRKGRLFDSLPETAVRRYEENYRRLAAEVPEFAVWANLTDHQATRGTVERIGGELLNRLENLTTGLAGVSELMRQMAGHAAVDRARHDLVIRYRRGIEASILSGADAPEGVVLPSLAEAYVNPRCRVCDAGANARPADESWWEDFGVVSSVQELICGLLTGPRAAVAPLVVLGHPGAGKSVLTKVLAARLAGTDLLPVRVELRSVPADAEIQEQIEHAIQDLTGRRISWPDLVDEADGALPVVMLDGFDELLQATGVNRSGYLEQVAQFQRREYELGRPVAVIVTSRTVVADRARIPSASVVLKLEPFNDAEVEAWLGVWNESNGATFAARGIRPFPAGAALAHPELASQPLLLMMLVLYDAGDNGLQSAGDDLSRAELYEQLFADFARREVRKHYPNVDDGEERREIETELRQLAVVALAMFNRRAQVVTETDLNKDLRILLAKPDRVAAAIGLDKPLGAVQLIVGRFFFVHESRALRDGGKEHAFEFLHATFGEFLVARIVVDALRELVEARAFNNRRTTPGRLDDSFLWSALSFAALAGSAAIVDFTTGLLQRLSTDERAAISELTTELLRQALYSQPTRSFADYEPMPLPVSIRHAAFSCNLAVLTVLSADGPVPAYDWNTSLWWSELSAYEWNGLRDTVRMERRLDPDHPQMPLWARREDGSPIRPFDEDTSSTLDDQGSLSSNYEHFIDLELPAQSEAGKNLRTAAFFRNSLASPRGLASILIPYYRYVDSGGTAFSRQFHMLFVPPAQIFLELRLAPFEVHGSELRVQLYNWCFGVLGRSVASSIGRAMLLRQLREDAPYMDPQVVIDLLADNRVPNRNTEIAAVLDILEIVGKPPTQSEKTPARIFGYLEKWRTNDRNSGLTILRAQFDSLAKNSDDSDAV